MYPVDLDPELDPDSELPILSLGLLIDLPSNSGVESDPGYGLQYWF